MTSKHTGVLGLAVGTILWLGLTGWVLSTAVPGESPPPGHPATGSSSPQEPPTRPTVWGRLETQAHSLFLRRPTDQDCRAVGQAVEGIGVHAWHQAGKRGRGVKVAILDSGFKGYRAALGKVLPRQIAIRSFRKDANLEARESQHGILCGEVVHHLAPEAEILFANWEPEQPGSFLEAVRWARQEGAKVISCSIIMPSWSDGEGGGGAHAALRSALGSGAASNDGLFFASAGNTALRHWGGANTPGKDGWHQWSRGKPDNSLRPYSQDRVSVELTSCGQPGFEIVVLDTTRPHEIGRSQTQPGNGCATAVVRFDPQPGHRYSVRVRAVVASENGKPAGRFHLTVLGGKLQYATQGGSIPFPGDGPEVVAVGAVDARGLRHGYSSCGPCGKSAKPDLAAVVPFPSLWRPEQPFSGTSAAAPQAAGVAALVWAAHPEWTANQVREALARAATKVRTGHCPETGHGLVRLPR